ncbi:MAG: hypothetical protein ACLUGY_21535 [Phocaeicola massiliensis]
MNIISMMYGGSGKRNSFPPLIGHPETEHCLRLYRRTDSVPTQQRRKEFERQKAELLADIGQRENSRGPSRNLYAVNIPDDSGINYLYWDRPYPRTAGKDIPAAPQGTAFLAGLTAEFWNGKSRVWTSGKEFYSFWLYVYESDRDTDSQRLASGFLSGRFTGIDYPQNIPPAVVRTVRETVSFSRRRPENSFP